MKSMENRKAGWLAVVLLAAILTNARGDIQPGARFDQVTRELGNGYSSTRIGNAEVLSYKNGIRVRLENDVVTEITQHGQIGVTREKLARNDLDQQDRSDHHQTVQQGGKTLVLTVHDDDRGAVLKFDGQDKPADPTPGTSVQAESPAAPNAPKKGERSSGVASASKNAAGRLQPPNIPQALGKPGTVLAHIQQVAMRLVLLLYAMALLAYAFSCYCYKRICQKAGQTPGALIWIPVVQFIPLLRVAQMADWMLILLLIPVVNVVAMLMLWARICTALKKSPWLAASLFVPVVNFILIPYLAFSRTARAEG